MQLNFQNTLPDLSQKVQNTPVQTRHSSAESINFAQEKNIQKIEQQNLVNGYFKLFGENHSDVAIKNLISARLQPAYVLPEIHDTQALSDKAAELLDFSIAI